MVISELPRLTIDHRGSSYEGIAAASSVGMALMESSGVRALIDEACTFDRGQRILSPGMGVKALIGPVFNLRNKSPLYIVNKNYASAPNDYIFGDRVCVSSLNDDALGRTLDTIAREDTELLFTRCSDICVEKYDLDSQTVHDDSTNIPFYGMRHDDVPADEIHPDHACSPKDHRRDLLHFCFQLSVNGNGFIRHMRAYSGDAADCIMDGDTLDFLGRTMTREQRLNLVYVADSKFMTGPNIRRASRIGVGFVSRCPAIFGGSAQERVLEKAIGADAWAGSERYPELMVFDTDETVVLDDTELSMRFIVTLEPKKRDALVDSKMKEVVSVDPFRKLIGKVYSTREEAVEAATSVKIPKFGIAEYTVTESEREIKRPGRKPVDYVPEMEPCWILESASVSADTDSIIRWATEESMFVLATDLPRTDADCLRYRDGMTADGIIMIYREEYVVEHAFRFMKSGLGIDTVFLQTPSRERAMMFVIAIAAMITSLADALFRRKKIMIGGREATMYLLGVELLTTTVELDRAGRKLSIRGPTEVNERFFEYTDALEINPRYLLGHT